MKNYSFSCLWSLGEEEPTDQQETRIFFIFQCHIGRMLQSMWEGFAVGLKTMKGTLQVEMRRKKGNNTWTKVTQSKIRYHVTVLVIFLYPLLWQSPLGHFRFPGNGLTQKHKLTLNVYCTPSWRLSNGSWSQTLLISGSPSSTLTDIKNPKCYICFFSLLWAYGIFASKTELCP